MNFRKALLLTTMVMLGGPARLLIAQPAPAPAPVKEVVHPLTFDDVLARERKLTSQLQADAADIRAAKSAAGKGSPDNTVATRTQAPAMAANATSPTISIGTSEEAPTLGGTPAPAAPAPVAPVAITPPPTPPAVARVPDLPPAVAVANHGPTAPASSGVPVTPRSALPSAPASAPLPTPVAISTPTPEVVAPRALPVTPVASVNPTPVTVAADPDPVPGITLRPEVPDAVEPVPVKRPVVIASRSNPTPSLPSSPEPVAPVPMPVESVRPATPPPVVKTTPARPVVPPKPAPAPVAVEPVPVKPAVVQTPTPAPPKPAPAPPKAPANDGGGSGINLADMAGDQDMLRDAWVKYDGGAQTWKATWQKPRMFHFGMVLYPAIQKRVQPGETITFETGAGQPTAVTRNEKGELFIKKGGALTPLNANSLKTMLESKIQADGMSLFMDPGGNLVLSATGQKAVMMASRKK